MDTQALLKQTDAAALAVLKTCRSPIGLRAAATGYPQVWARDAVITFMGAALDRDPESLECLRISMETLGAHQNEFGQVPYLVDLAERTPAFAGYLDAVPWFVIGCCRYAQLSGDSAWLARHADFMARALKWCESRDVRRNGLMEGDQALDWADIMPSHGAVLFPNVVRIAALDLAMAQLPGHGDAGAWRKQRDHAARAIQDRLWVRPENQFTDREHVRTRALAAITLRRRPYFLAWESLFEFGDRMDVPGNLLTILTGVADPAQSHSILDHIEAVGINRPYPVQVIHPCIQQGDPDWKDYFRIYNLNLPEQYCNGGIWPWVGGLYIAALVKAGRLEEARRQLISLAESNRAGSRDIPEWRFSEWLHGRHGTASGEAHQAWSAGMWLFAHHAVETGRLPGFGGCDAP